MIATTVDEEGTRRAVTKLIEGERLVSCTCCTTIGCCMYPADQLGVDYTEDDLPDEVIVQFPDEPPSTWSRSGSYFVLGNLSLRPVGARWALFRDEDEEGDRGVQCLIEPDLLAPRVTDNFADSYTLDGGGFTITVYRTSLCRWEATDDNYPSGVGEITGTVNGLIDFDGNISNDELSIQRFTASIGYSFPELQDAGSFGGTKENNNTPAGDYEFNGNVEITVT